MEYDVQIVANAQAMCDVLRHGDDLTAWVKDTFDFLVVVDEREYRAKGMRFLRDGEILHVGFLARRETTIIILNRVANDCRTRRGRSMLMGDSRREVTFNDSVVVGVKMRFGELFLVRVAASGDSFTESSANFGGYR